MRNARRLSSIVALLVLAAIALLLRGCLQAEESDFVRYDAQRDEFRALMIQRGISGTDADDLAYLKAFFQNRDYLLMPLTAGLPLFDIRLLRLSDRTFAVTPFTSAPSTLDVHDSPVSLNQITITPGIFFVEDKTLCYYHAITVPGKVIDGALDQISIAAQTDDIRKPLEDELARRQQGGRRQTWADYTAESLRSIDESAQPTASSPATTEPAGAASQPGADKGNPLTCLDEESLHDLITALAAKSLRIHRAGALFSVTLPLSPADSRAIAAAYKTISQHLHAFMAQHPDAPDLREQDAITRALAITDGNGGITATLDPVRLSHILPKLGPLPALTGSDDDKKTATARIDTLQFIRDQKLPLDETLTSAQILADFNANRLPAHPSTAPVAPGAGMVKPKSPDTPATLP